jgi:hypothetical protein
MTFIHFIALLVIKTLDMVLSRIGVSEYPCLFLGEKHVI